MAISIHRLHECDAEELFQFEKTNRLFFEKMVPSREEDYFQFNMFKIKHRERLAEQKEKRQHSIS
ncbi:hypothetical protein P9D34_07695 [Bacillus swezeyi]|uniref:hypothetical protein n=1 Tax=Bacillus swezeyi TaxID=1925020 RepID=UPI0009F82753|nr:hypothetical protein [Bacillus swezeyi]MEC1260330.1 hypothetical protein [Bacillus swezeyi]MED2929937.1 hypothetical protein [Bacillus swezeyi]MED2942887.1 hypothetical protein [Bacillus swezeyi]MED2964649.1 hypothetical protein [Bacillus swezeyi]MED2976538.1 hypothetical protein [Bacillus swezeyi]